MKLKIAVIDLKSENPDYATNKDLSGGMGTRTVIGKNPFARIIQYLKSRAVSIPLLSAAYLIPIIGGRGHQCLYFDRLPDQECDVYLVNSSIVDYRHEIRVAKELKSRYKDSKVGFFGTFATVKPEFFKGFDFLVSGQVESLFLYDKFDEKGFFSGTIKPSRPLALDDLPTPDFGSFDYKRFRYWPALTKTPVLTLLSSEGCPFSCSYYCPYTILQGKRYNPRSVRKLIKDIERLKKDYGVRSIQFRDPIFSFQRKRVEDFCRQLCKRKIQLEWGCETRLDFLDRDLLKMMRGSGLRTINVGIESADENVMKASRRLAIKKRHQEDMISYCKNIGIKVNAFYILGQKDDTLESMEHTFRYACKLNTHIAQFTICTPYPGTDFYEDMERKGLLLTKNYEMYDINHLVYKHPRFTARELFSIKERYFILYYFRPAYMLDFIRWRIRDLF
jgi:anaerobic magnesium-protoporphyrin IX monomethyl ester cyclase